MTPHEPSGQLQQFQLLAPPHAPFQHFLNVPLAGRGMGREGRGGSPCY